MMRFIPYGPDAWMIEFATEPGEDAFARCHRLIADIEKRPPLGLREWSASYTRILLEFAPGRSPARLWEWILSDAPSENMIKGSQKTIRVKYNGPDLQRVADHAGLSVDEVIELHSARPYLVQFLGFSPGFPYLHGLDPRLATPRLNTPRIKISAGSVAIGGSQTGIYSLASAGGWNIIGQTKTVLFDFNAPLETAFHLAAGDHILFEPI
jgi:hypothetical protein